MKDSQDILHDKQQFEVLYRNIINSVPNPLFIKDDKHRWIVFNDAFCNFLGVERSELFGKSDYEFFAKHQADVFWEKDDIVLKTGKSNVNEEEITTDRGEHFTILTSKVRINDEKGNFYILGTITDITEMKFEESQLEKKNIQINAQKNEIHGLIKETHRQTEQNLQIISDLIKSLTNKITEKKSLQLLNGLNDWVSSMISLHQFFFKSLNLDSISLVEYFKTLGAHTLKDSNKSISFNVEGKPVVLPLSVMIPLGLMVNELLLSYLNKDELKDNEIALDIDVNYATKRLEVIFSSNIPINELEKNSEYEFRTEDLMKILVDQIDGSIEFSDFGRKIMVSTKQVVSFEKGYF
ncbi:MAG TPA: hypothetical protein DCX54_13630 [Flavobacteriales bacterium]|nr:hypothetical protein [Flavobacteriales bacterium]